MIKKLRFFIFKQVIIFIISLLKKINSKKGVLKLLKTFQMIRYKIKLLSLVISIIFFICHFYPFTLRTFPGSRP